MRKNKEGSKFLGQLLMIALGAFITWLLVTKVVNWLEMPVVIIDHITKVPVKIIRPGLDGSVTEEVYVASSVLPERYLVDYN